MGASFVLDTDKTPGDATRVHLPHPELFAALEPETRLLVDDGKLVLRVKQVTADRIETLVEVGGRISDRKGVNVPDVVVPLAALTEKDRRDLRSEERRLGKEGDRTCRSRWAAYHQKKQQVIVISSKLSKKQET